MSLPAPPSKFNPKDRQLNRYGGTDPTTFGDCMEAGGHLETYEASGFVICYGCGTKIKEVDHVVTPEEVRAAVNHAQAAALAAANAASRAKELAAQFSDQNQTPAAVADTTPGGAP